MTPKIQDVTKISGRGMPRPLAETDYGKLSPVPWSQGTSWGTLHHHRQQVAVLDSRCLVCGDKVHDGKVLVRKKPVDGEFEAPAFEQEAEDAPRTYNINALGWEGIVDLAPLHDRCAALTEAHCETVKERVAAGNYVWRPYERGRRKAGNRKQHEIEYA